MLIIYRKADGKTAAISGTNSALPEGPPFEAEVQNTIQAHGGEPSDYGEYRLHDVEDAELVQAIMAAGSATILFDSQGKPVGAEPLEVPRPEPEPAPDPTGFLDAAIDYMGPLDANTLLAKYPLLYPAVIHLDTGATALGIVDAMLAQQDITQEQYGVIQGLWDGYHMPRPE